MSNYLIDPEELEDKIHEQLRAFRSSSAATDYRGWYRVQQAIARARDMKIYHTSVDLLTVPNFFDANQDPITWYHRRDPQQVQVNMLQKNLKISSQASRKRGRVTAFRLKLILNEILALRIERYLNPPKKMKKLKLLCILGESGAGKTLASLHLKYHKDANVICSFTTRPPRSTEVEGRDHHFIDIVPDRSDMLAYAYFGGYFYYALKDQVFGPCTVYVVDEKGLANLRKDFSDEYEIYTVLIRRERKLRRKAGVDFSRMHRDYRRELNDSDYDWVIRNNGTKKAFFDQIEAIYEEIKNK